jgi:hypothetical protein
MIATTLADFTNQAVSTGRIRSQLHNDTLYFSMLDFCRERLQTDHKTAQNYLHVLRHRMRANQTPIPNVIRLRAKTSDGKFYLTDFTDLVGLQTLDEVLEANLKKKSLRLDIRHDDEVNNFHPLVVHYLQQRGFAVQHHIQLESGGTVDVLAIAETTYVIECKPTLSRAKLYSAIGQALCYALEMGNVVKPAIASYEDSMTGYARLHCEQLGIWLIAIPKPHTVV